MGTEVVKRRKRKRRKRKRRKRKRRKRKRRKKREACHKFTLSSVVARVTARM